MRLVPTSIESSSRQPQGLLLLLLLLLLLFLLLLSSGGTFLPTLEDYEDYNINLAGDETAELNTEVYDFKDVLHSIRD